MQVKSWVIFAYKIPSEPSSIRVRVWRNLKTIGVHYLQQSVCIFPSNDETVKKVKKLQILINQNGGETTLLEIEKLASPSEKELIQSFNNQRSIEYKEFLKATEQFLREIEQETLEADFSFGEIEENEAALDRLKKWFSKIQKRDFFSCETQEKALSELNSCVECFEKFMEEVYNREGLLNKQE